MKLHTNFDEAAYVYNTFDDIDIFVKHFWDNLPEFTATSQTSGEIIKKILF